MSTPERPEPPPEFDAALQRALADAVTAFGARVREHGELPAFPADRQVDGTDVAFATAAMLKASGIYSFEIAALFNI
jgi:hypothetical protein